MARKFSGFTDGLTNQSPTDTLVGLDLSLSAANQNSYWTLNSLFSVITRNITDGALRFQGFAAPAVSAAGSGSLYFDLSSNTFKISQNGGAYVDIHTGVATVPQGGTGLSSLTAYAVLAGGTTSTGNIQQVSGLGTSGQVLTSNGAGALPTWQAVSGSPAGSGSELQYRASASAFGAITGSSVSGANLTMTGIAQAVIQDVGGQVFNVKAYGAVGNGIANDTAAIQAAATAALAVSNSQGGKGAVVFFPPGSYLITSTIYINNVANDPNFNLQAEISILGSGRLVTSLVWGGSSGGTALRFWFNKRYSFKEMYIVNAANDRTGIGIRSIGATSVSGNVSGGNAIWQNIEVRGFEKGWYIGDSVSQTSGSEYVIDNLATTNCVYGVLLEGSNTENLTFRIPQFSSCQYGLYNGGGNNIHIWGGASSATSTAVFTNVTQGEMSIVGFRSESDNAFIHSNVGGMYVAACTVTNNTSAGKIVTSHIGGPFRLTFINNTFDGVVTLTSSTHGEESYLRMLDNRLFYTAALTVPFLVTSGGSGTIKGMGLTLAGNKQYAADQTTFIQKFPDVQGASTDGSIANIAQAIQFNPDTSNGVATPATPQLNLETLTSINTTSANKATFGGAITASFETKAGDPTTSDIAASRWALYKNTSSGVLSLWANDGGVMKSVALT